MHFAALVAAYYLGPRIGLKRQRERIIMGNAQGSLVGLFMIWWAFLAFNSGRYVTTIHYRMLANMSHVSVIQGLIYGCVVSLRFDFGNEVAMADGRFSCL